MAARFSTSRPAARRAMLSDTVRRLSIAAGVVGFVLVGGVAAAAGVSLETAAVRAVVASAILGGLAAGGGYMLDSGASRAIASAPSAPPRRRGQLVDFELPEEGGG